MLHPCRWLLGELQVGSANVWGRAHSVDTIGLGSVGFWSGVIHATIFYFIHVPPTTQGN